MSANKPVWEIPMSSDEEIARLAAAAAGAPAAVPTPAPSGPPAYELPVEVPAEAPFEAVAPPRASHDAWPPPGQPPVPPAQAGVPATELPTAPPIVEVVAVASAAQLAPAQV